MVKENIMDVVLLSAPYDFPPRPSLALSLFQPLLEEAGFAVKIVYPMMRMCELMGEDVLRGFLQLTDITLHGEYLFSGLTGQKDYSDLDEYISLASFRIPDLDPDHYRYLITQGIRAAREIVEETAQEISLLSPKVLAASSLFAQQNASLAILKRVKELLPEVKTMMGGPNCAGMAGKILLKYYPQVDAVFFGEGDEVFGEAVKALIEDAPLPYGVVRKEERDSLEMIPYRLTKDMDTMPIPQFDDFLPVLAQLSRASDGLRPIINQYYGKKCQMVILIEGSRGCWWGEKHPCTFCALNGEHNVYRTKSPGRIFKELMDQTEKYETLFVEFTDNVLSNDAIRELLPMMKAAGRHLVCMAEVKPNLKEEEIFALKAAGFRYVQSGLESLNGHLMRLMGKGNTVAGHIAFLKYCRRSGLIPLWNFLYRIPGEEQEDYEMLINLLPKLFHLPPPTGFSRILFERGSCYVSHPEQYGLELAPDRYYRYCFGENEEIIKAMALYYEDLGGDASFRLRKMKPWHDRLIAQIQEWKRVYSRKEGCHLVMTDRGDYLMIADTRPCRKTALSFLTGAARDICLSCNHGTAYARMERMLLETYAQEEITNAFSYLLKSGYVICPDGMALTLATLGDS